MDRLLCIQLLLLSTLTVSVSAFGVLPQSSSASLSTTTGSASPLQSAVSLGTFKPQHTVSSTRLYAGFGAGGGSSSNNKKKKKKKVVQKLKPKQQWDRYCDLKTENRVRVAVRLQEDASGESSDNDNNNNNNNNSEWLEVGRVKSKDNAYTELAVMKQKAIIAEVRIDQRVHVALSLECFPTVSVSRNETNKQSNSTSFFPHW